MLTTMYITMNFKGTVKYDSPTEATHTSLEISQTNVFTKRRKIFQLNNKTSFYIHGVSSVSRDTNFERFCFYLSCHHLKINIYGIKLSL